MLHSQDIKISPEAAAELAKSPAPPPGNVITGVEIDRFVGNPFLSPVRVIDGALLVRSILRGGDPYRAGDPGAVLQYRKDYAYAILLPNTKTPLSSVPEQWFLYVEGGKGRVDDGAQYWDLREGVGVLVPPAGRRRLTNTGDEPLQMLLLSWTPQPGAKPDTKILVRNTDSMPYNLCGGQNCHWSYFGKNLFNASHGLSPREGIHVVWVPPMSIGEPHAHVRNWEEIWTKLPPGDTYLTLGSEVRGMPPNTAFLAPPNAKTVHAVLNLTKDKPQAFLFISTFIFDQPHSGRDPLVPPKQLSVP